MPTPLAAGMAPGFNPAFFGQLKKHWGWLLALGIIDIILGTVALGMTFWVTIASVFIYGVFLLVGGGIQFIQAFKFKGWKGVLLHVVVALLYLFAGGLIVYRPLLASVILTLWLGAAILVAGIFRAVLALQHREQRNWGWVLLGGLISIALGGMIIGQWPATGLWVIGLFIAIDLIFQGWSCMALAFAAKAEA